MKRFLFLSLLFLMPFLAHGQDGGGVKSIDGVPGPFTFTGSGVSCVGIVCTFNGGSGSLPTALSGQIITNNNGSTGYAGQANVFYQQSGDTVASIETACTSAPCTYVVTNPQTITLAASHTLNANVNLYFMADGSWTVNGSTFTLTIPSRVDGTVTMHFPAGTGSVSLAGTTDIPVEWFGATGNGTTDDTVAIQACFNAIVKGQCALQATTYKTTAALNIGTSSVTKSGVGLHGVIGGYWPSTISSTSASADILDVVGVSTGNESFGGKFNNFNLARTVTPTGTAAGLSFNYAGGYTVDNVASNDSIRDYYYHAGYSYGVGVTQNSSAGWILGETSGTFTAFYLDSADGNAENSIRFLNDAVGGPASAIPTTTGMLLTGTAVNDVMTYGFETAHCTFGQVVNYTGAGASATGQDIHFIGSIIDTYGTNAFLIQSVPTSSRATVTIENAWMSGTATSTVAVSIASSSGVVVSDSQIKPIHGSGILASGSSSVVIANNQISEVSGGVGGINAVEFTGTTHSAVTGNSIATGSGNFGNIIWLTGNSTFNAITGNAITGFSSSGYGIGLDAGSNNNGFFANSIDATNMFGPIGDAGTGNGVLSAPARVIPTIATVGFLADLTGEPGGTLTQYPTYKGVGPQTIAGWLNNTPTEAWSLGYTIPNGTAANNPIFSFFNGSAWAGAWFIDVTNGNINLIKNLALTTTYSAAGTALPTCNTAAKGTYAQVSDATSPTYLGTYSSGGAVFAPVVCNGTNWVTH